MATIAEELHARQAELRRRMSMGIAKGFEADIVKAEEIDIEKAHKDGDMHPNGKWVWVSSANGGKGDWRTAGGRTHKAHAAASGGTAQKPSGKTWDKGDSFNKKGSDENKLWNAWYKFQISGDPQRMGQFTNILEKKFPNIAEWNQTAPNTGKAIVTAKDASGKEIAKIDLSGDTIDLTKLQTFMDKCHAAPATAKKKATTTPQDQPAINTERKTWRDFISYNNSKKFTNAEQKATLSELKDMLETQKKKRDHSMLPASTKLAAREAVWRIQELIDAHEKAEKANADAKKKTSKKQEPIANYADAIQTALDKKGYTTHVTTSGSIEVYKKGDRRALKNLKASISSVDYIDWGGHDDLKATLEPVIKSAISGKSAKPAKKEFSSSNSDDLMKEVRANEKNIADYLGGDAEITGISYRGLISARDENDKPFKAVKVTVYYKANSFYSSGKERKQPVDILIDSDGYMRSYSSYYPSPRAALKSEYSAANKYRHLVPTFKDKFESK